MINRNLKTMLLGVFAMIASTEMIYPIIFTGPAGRAAQGHEAEDAYAAGMAAGAGGMMGAQNQEDNSNDYSDDESDENSDVAIQMFSNGNFNGIHLPDSDSSDNESDNFDGISLIDDESSDENNDQANLDASFIVTAAENNDSDNGSDEEFLDQYGDDLLARGQAQEQDRQQALNEPNEFAEEVVAVQYPVENNEENEEVVQEVIFPEESSQDLNRSDNNPEFINPEEPFGVDQALQDAELNDDLAAVNQDAGDDVATQSVEPEVYAQPVAVPTLLAAPVEKIKEVQAPAVQPALAVTHAPVVAMPASEQVRIVKVYPVYDAVRSAVKAVNNAVHDMINYVYSFVNSPKVAQPAPAIQTEPAQPVATK